MTSRCSHGSTTGAIDRKPRSSTCKSRGVPVEIGTDLLVLAFLDEAIQEIEDERLADDIPPEAPAVAWSGAGRVEMPVSTDIVASWRRPGRVMPPPCWTWADARIGR